MLCVIHKLGKNGIIYSIEMVYINNQGYSLCITDSQGHVGALFEARSAEKERTKVAKEP